VADSTQFSIDIATTGAQGLESAAVGADKLAGKLTLSGSAATTAADAMKSAELRYFASKNAAEQAARAVEQIGAAAAAQKGKLEEALAVGDTTGAARAASELETLIAKQGEAKASATAAAASFASVTESIDTAKYGAAAIGVAQLGAELTQATTAATTAAEAVRAGEAAYNQAEAAANRAALALEKIKTAAEAQRGVLKAAMDAGDASSAERAAAKLANLVQRQGEAAKAADTAAAAMNAEAASLDKLKASSGAADEAQKRVAASLDAAKKSAIAAKNAADQAAGSGKANEIAEGLGKLGGPIGALGQKVFGTVDAFKKLGGSLGSTTGLLVGSAAAATVVAVAFVAVTAAALAGLAAITKWAVGLADGARNFALLNAGIAGSIKGGEELTNTIGDLSKRVPQSEAELQSMAAQLAKTGLKGDELAAALEDAAAKAAEAKFGPEWQKQLLSIDKLTQTFGRNTSKLFGGLKIEGLLEGVSKLVGLFDETSASGRAIKVVFESLFQPLVDGITAFIPKMVAAFIQFEILVLKALIAIKPFGSKILAVAEVFGAMAVTVLAAGAILIGAFVAVGAAMALMVGYVVGGSTAFMSFGETIRTTVGGAFDWLQAKFNEAIAFLQSIDLAEIGTAMIAGLAGGITGGAAALVSSVTGAVGGAIDAAKKMLGIASPSKVFAEIGANTAEGFTGGVEASTGGAATALESLVSPPAAASSAPAAAPAAVAVSGGGHTFNITVNASGAADGESIADLIHEKILDLLEGSAAQRGAMVPAGA
jgi:hypothetical protein